LAQTSKELIKGLFDHNDLNKVPFIPWVCSFAAKLEQVPAKTMLSDSGILSRALINAQKLFGYDVIVNIFDSSLEAEACGCEIEWPDNESSPVIVSHPLAEGENIGALNTSDFEMKGRIPVVLEATKRLAIIKGKEVAIAGIVTGPLTIARHLRGEAFLDDLNQGKDEADELIEEVGSICLRLCRAYCELGIDIVVIAEEMLGQLKPEIFQVIASSLQSIWNVVGYYNVHSLILSKGCSETHIEPVFELNADGVALSGSVDYQIIKENAIERHRCFARSIPDSVLLGIDPLSRDSVHEYLLAKDKGLFLSTEWDVPYSADVNSMHEIMKNIRDNQGS